MVFGLRHLHSEHLSDSGLSACRRDGNSLTCYIKYYIARASHSSNSTSYSCTISTSSSSSSSSSSRSSSSSSSSCSCRTRKGQSVKQARNAISFILCSWGLKPIYGSGPVMWFSLCAKSSSLDGRDGQKAELPLGN
ncbi:hypothetical protein PV325_003372 [Microctonus aethiopoides]|nr:hypothetical protein PV325_003372 [Microctonus aethiopoides]